MFTSAPLILDLDGTLLFKEERPAALTVKGRRRDTYLAQETLDQLYSLQQQYPLVLATGRSVISVSHIRQQLSERNIHLFGAVAENGGVWLDQANHSHYLVEPIWLSLIARINQEMGTCCQAEFQTCIALVKPNPEDRAYVEAQFKQSAWPYKILPDGNKLFFLAESVDKLPALQAGLPPNSLKQAIGIGNDLNDLNWLKAVGLGAAPNCAHPQVHQLLNAQKGMIAEAQGHDGILELLTFISTISPQNI